MDLKRVINKTPHKLKCGRFTLPLNRPLVMGILNLTPDSFSDGGRFDNTDGVLSCAESMIESGVDIIDVGAESTRPGSEEVNELIIFFGETLSVDNLCSAKYLILPILG